MKCGSTAFRMKKSFLCSRIMASLGNCSPSTQVHPASSPCRPCLLSSSLFPLEDHPVLLLTFPSPSLPKSSSPTSRHLGQPLTSRASRTLAQSLSPYQAADPSLRRAPQVHPASSPCRPCLLSSSLFPLEDHP